MILILLSQLFFSCLVKLTKSACVNKFAHAKMREFRWAGFNNFIVETYLAVSFSLAINTSNVSMVTGADITNNIFAGLLAIVYIS